MPFLVRGLEAAVKKSVASDLAVWWREPIWLERKKQKKAMRHRGEVRL